MFSKQTSSGKIGLIMATAAFVLGMVIFIGFGSLAGTFSSNKGFVDSLTGSPFGWAALFGITLILAAPLIGLTIFAYDRAIKMEAERLRKEKSHGSY